MDEWEAEVMGGKLFAPTSVDGSDDESVEIPAPAVPVVPVAPAPPSTTSVSNLAVDAVSTKRKDAPGSDGPSANSLWEAVDATDLGVKKALKEIEAFWTHGSIASSQVESAKVRVRGSRRSKTNTDFEMDVRVQAVLYKCHIKGHKLQAQL